MSFVYLFLGILIIVFLKYAYLIIKRLHLIRKILKQIKKHNGILKKLISPL